MSLQYLEEGRQIKESVMERLQKCRKDSKTLYRWSQASLMDLHEIVDESLADELYFMVRGKMARILSTISIFEEAAEQIEKSLSSYFPNGPPVGIPEGGSPTGTGPNINNSSNLQNRCHFNDNNLIPNMTSILEDVAEIDVDDDEEELDLRIEIPDRDSPDENDVTGTIDDLMLSWSFGSGAIRAVHTTAEKPDEMVYTGRMSEDSTPRSGSTPEPPLSPRPRALVNHPKIAKLQSMALPNRGKFLSQRLGQNRSSTAW
jgi:hypothetical protein